MVAVGAGLHLGGDECAMGMVGGHRRDGGDQLFDRTAGPAAPLRAGPRVRDRFRRVSADHGGRDRCAVRRRQSGRAPQQRRRVLPTDARRHRSRRAIDHDRGVHLLGGRHRASIRRGAQRKGQGRPQGQDSPGRDRLGDDRHRHPRGARRGPLRGRLVQPDSVVHDWPLQQPDAPQVADRRRHHWLHGRRRHRGSLAR